MALFSRTFFTRLFNWEYWSFGMVYTWIYPIWFFLCLRARSFLFFAAANPRISNGGFLNESKKDIYAIMPQYLYPPTRYYSPGDSTETVVDDLKQAGFDFPMIGKPDIGGRGRGIKILRTNEDVRFYASKAVTNFHIQQFVPYPNEVGIFYHRTPGQPAGKLSGIVRKEFMEIEGDGQKSIGEIVKADKRYQIYYERLEKTVGDKLQKVLASGEKELLVPFGNHARGAKFLDDSHLIDEALTATIDRICQQIPEFYYGRLDIRYNNWEELKAGKNLSVIEVNGAGSEPTHMYDPRHSLFFAWKEIVRHWIILWKISRANHRLGHPYLSVKEGIKMFREDKINSQLLEKMPE